MDRRPHGRLGLFGVLLAVTGLVVGWGGVASAARSAPSPPHVPVPQQGTGELRGIATEFGANDSGMPPGVVNGPCTPSPSHPYPVVLVHGTFANENFTWQTLAPLLSDAGYCVFGLNYGATSWTAASGDRYYAIDYVEHSASQLERFIAGTALPDTVEPAHNAAGYHPGAHPAQVDVVGHSQGGMMPRYLVDKTSSSRYPGLGETGQIHALVGLAPSNHGSNAYGMVPIFARLFGANVYSFPTSAGCPACGEQEAGSSFLQALNAQPDTARVNYYVIESNRDEVVTPYTSAFLPPADNVQNVTLQSQCAADLTEHVGITYDPVALQDVMSALANNGTRATPLPQPSCPAAVLPVVSG